MAQLFLEAGANFDPNLKFCDHSQKTMLAEAISREDLELVTLLVDLGAVCTDDLHKFPDRREATMDMFFAARRIDVERV